MLEKSLIERWQEMQNRNQRQSENTAEYFFDKLRLRKALNMDLDETKTQITVGLWSKEISTAIMTRSYFDNDGLLRSITELEALETPTKKQRININRDTLRNHREGNSFGSTQKEENRQGHRREYDKVNSHQGSSTSGKSSGGNVSSDRLCYRCNKVGI